MSDGEERTHPDELSEPSEPEQPRLVEQAGFQEPTERYADPTTRRVSKQALRELIAANNPAVPPPPAPPKADDPLSRLQRARQVGANATGQEFGDYTLHGIIGRGGMAEVWLATQRRPEGVRVVVVKVQLPELARDPAAKALFVEEGRISAQLRHPNIVSLVDRGEVGGRPYLAFELIDGLSLRELGRLLSPRRLPVRAALEVGAEVAAALAYAHELRGEDGRPLEVVHRDVTPHNVLIDRRCRVKLVDFGIARFHGRDHQTRAGAIRGKLGYLAPEQLAGGLLDARTDLYLLGLLVLELLLGRQVLSSSLVLLDDVERRVAEALVEVEARAGREVRALLETMTYLDPARRLARAAEAELRFRHLAEGAKDENLATFVSREIFLELPPWEEGGTSAATLMEVTRRVPPLEVPAAPRPATPTYSLDAFVIEDETYGEALRRLREGASPNPTLRLSAAPPAPTWTPEAGRSSEPPAPLVGPNLAESAPTVRLSAVLDPRADPPTTTRSIPLRRPAPRLLILVAVVVTAAAAALTYWLATPR